MIQPTTEAGEGELDKTNLRVTSWKRKRERKKEREKDENQTKKSKMT
jgi:hypothetical protein